MKVCRKYLYESKNAFISGAWSSPHNCLILLVITFNVVTINKGDGTFLLSINWGSENCCSLQIIQAKPHLTCVVWDKVGYTSLKHISKD